MLKKIDHIGIAVKTIDDAVKFYTEALAQTVEHVVEVPSQKVKTAFIKVGDVHIELLEPTSPESPIAGFLEKRGPGIHHLCFEVEDIHAALKRLAEQGVALIDKAPREGAHGKLVAFVHPKSAGGVLVELSQRK